MRFSQLSPPLQFFQRRIRKGGCLGNAVDDINTQYINENPGSIEMSVPQVCETYSDTMLVSVLRKLTNVLGTAGYTK